MTHPLNGDDVRTTYSYASGISQSVDPVGPVVTYTYDIPEDNPPVNPLPIDSKPAGCTLVTISTEDERLLARCRPLGGITLEDFPSDDDFPDRSTARDEEPYAVAWIVKEAWPISVVIRFYQGDNLLEIREVRV